MGGNQVRGEKSNFGGLSKYAIGEGQNQASFEAPLRDAKKLILLAGNYREHIQEVGYQVPQHSVLITPQFFMKPPSSTVIGHEQPIVLPQNSL